MVLSLYNEQYDQMRPILLNSWRSHFRFRGLLIFNEEMLIVRTGSLSVFRAIQEELYRFEHFSEESLNIMQEMECTNARRAMEVERVFSKEESEF
jgi:hypothetical protein